MRHAFVSSRFGADLLLRELVHETKPEDPLFDLVERSPTARPSPRGASAALRSAAPWVSLEDSVIAVGPAHRPVRGCWRAGLRRRVLSTVFAVAGAAPRLIRTCRRFFCSGLGILISGTPRSTWASTPFWVCCVREREEAAESALRTVVAPLMLGVLSLAFTRDGEHVVLEQGPRAAGRGGLKECIEEPVHLVLDGVQLTHRFPANQWHVNLPFREAGDSVDSH